MSFRVDFWDPSFDLLVGARWREDSVPARRVYRSGGAMTVVPGPWSGFCTVYVDAPLRVPVSRDLRRRIRTLLRRGERGIVLDLSGVSRIDAAGVGELVRAYNMASAVNGFLRIVHATARVREILTRVGLFDLLSADRGAEYVAVT